MPAPLKDHLPIVLDKFNGLWQRGDVDNTPPDHFADCDNIKYVGTSGFASRDGVSISQNVSVPLSNVKRIYNYPTPNGNTLIVLTTFKVSNLSTIATLLDESDTPLNSFDDIPLKLSGNQAVFDLINQEDPIFDEEDSLLSSLTGSNVTTTIGRIYHVLDSTTVYGPILEVSGMEDFAFVPYDGRGYISPFASYVAGGLNVEKGVQNEVLYVYAGDGTVARPAAGQPISGQITVANGAAGFTDPGLHVFAIVEETISGYLTPPGAANSFTTLATNSVSIGNIPTSGSPYVINRQLVATKVISSFDGNLNGYQFFFVPGAIINNNTDTFINNVSFYDADLLEDASHLFDNYPVIPAGAALTLYHNRLCLATTFNDISIIILSSPGEPEAISQVDGLIIVPLDGNPITNMQELRDTLYVTKRARTVAYVDNGDVPSSWALSVIDNALGTSVHGIATVLDSGSSSVDYLLIATYQGVSLFNGRYMAPELSFKIIDLWQNLDRNEFRHIQILNAPIQKEIYIVLPTGDLLVGNYGNGMDPETIRWAPWSFVFNVNTVAVVNIDDIIIGADLL